ncbi:MAG: adenine phosphoribosyltransferase [Coriobacteriia bacterium]|nr:adenine phosphoribosyltransferase [Coriobacteriia bacterium]
MPEIFDFTKYIYDIPNYPENGVVFKDITQLLADPQAYAMVIDTIANRYMGSGVTKVLGAEARGFIIGAPIAYKLNAGFIPARKPGKLPRKTISEEYQLEYGVDILEIHEDAITKDDVVLIVDDVLATGGTASAKAEICKKIGAKVLGFAFVLELDFLQGAQKIKEAGDYEIYSLVHANK